MAQCRHPLRTWCPRVTGQSRRTTFLLKTERLSDRCRFPTVVSQIRRIPCLLKLRKRGRSWPSEHICVPGQRRRTEIHGPVTKSPIPVAFPRSRPRTVAPQDLTILKILGDVPPTLSTALSRIRQNFAAAPKHSCHLSVVDRECNGEKLSITTRCYRDQH